MTENKIPQKSGFGVGADKDFFSGAKPATQSFTVPHKPVAVAAPESVTVSADVSVPRKNDTNDSKEPVGKLMSEANPVKTLENVSGGLPQLRTYRQDVAEVMRDKKTSLVRLVLEEQRERSRREQEISPTSKKNLPLILLSAIFLFSAIGLVYYVYFFHINPSDHTLKDLNIVPLIFTEQNKEILIDGKEPLAIKGDIVSRIQNTDFKIDAIEYLFFTETLHTETPDGIIAQKNIVPLDKFFEAVEIKMPAMLLRSLHSDFMFGIHAFNKNQPFIILKTDYYDNAFAGMLAWENKVAADLLPLFGVRMDRVKELSQRKWGDTVIKNKDTRVLRNFDESISLVYMFKDQRTLIITTNEDTLLEVSRRLDLVKEKRPE